MPGQPKDPGSFTPAESNQYWDSYLSSRDTELDARADYESLWRRAPTAALKSLYRQRLVEIESNLLQIEDARTAYQAQSVQVAPPTVQEVNTLKAAAEEVDSLTAQAQNADRIFTLASNAATFFIGLHGAG